LLCRVAECEALGIDPSSSEANQYPGLSPQVSILSESFEGQKRLRDAKLVVCRQVLEHIHNPLEFVRNVRKTMGESSKGSVFFEVPNAQFMVEKNRFWDVIYEHCTYLSPNSLRSLFSNAGFKPKSVEATFGDQYVALEAVTDGLHLAKRISRSESAKSAEVWRRKVAHFSDSFDATIFRWRSFLSKCRENKKRVAIWGAGAKGIMFLNILRCDVATVPYVIDISPTKHGKFISGTGQEIVSPEILEQWKPDYILLTNGNYRDEIVAQLNAYPGIELLTI
jgi:hypothetical protein